MLEHEGFSLSEQHRQQLARIFAIHNKAISVQHDKVMQQTNLSKLLNIEKRWSACRVYSNKNYNKQLSLDLHKAVEQNDYTTAKRLINNPKVDINAQVD